MENDHLAPSFLFPTLTGAETSAYIFTTHILVCAPVHVGKKEDKGQEVIFRAGVG